MLLATPQRIAVSGACDDQIIALAGTNDARDQLTLLVSCYGGGAKSLSLAFENLPWKSPSACQVYRLDEHSNLVAQDLTMLAGERPILKLQATNPSVLLLRLMPTSRN
jgi:hypothetical protein